MKSMTGFGKTTCSLDNKVITIEIKSLNSKQLDIYTRLPNIYREKDLEIRNVLSKELQRGKIELNLIAEITDAKNAATINAPVVKEYYEQLKSIGKELSIDDDENIMQIIMRLPETLRLEKEELDEKEWKQIMDSISKAVESINRFRTQEGTALKKDILHRVDLIVQLLDQITPHEKDRIEVVRSRIKTSLDETINTDKIDNNRFEQELLYYLEKIDVTEEKVRLKNHCSYFKEVAEQSESAGKKLGFITQEMGREINTLGSKANYSDIQKIVVQMKDELEKIKEQLMNVL